MCVSHVDTWILLRYSLTPLSVSSRIQDFAFGGADVIPSDVSFIAIERDCLSELVGVWQHDGQCPRLAATRRRACEG